MSACNGSAAAQQEVVLVTGASSSIGAAIATRLAAARCRLRAASSAGRGFGEKAAKIRDNIKRR